MMMTTETQTRIDALTLAHLWDQIQTWEADKFEFERRLPYALAEGDDELIDELEGEIKVLGNVTRLMRVAFDAARVKAEDEILNPKPAESADCPF